MGEKNIELSDEDIYYMEIKASLKNIDYIQTELHDFLLKLRGTVKELDWHFSDRKGISEKGITIKKSYNQTLEKEIAIMTYLNGDEVILVEEQWREIGKVTGWMPPCHIMSMEEQKAKIKADKDSY
jgi:hypothetical protein